MGIKQILKMGFYYDQGFYYDKHEQEGFYYDGFYYEEKDGFYYDQQQRGFYYEGFYYDKEGEGRKRVVKALDGLRTQVDLHVTKNPHAANETQGRALSNVITVQVVKEVIKKFVKNVNPKEYFENGGDDKKISHFARQGVPSRFGTRCRFPRCMA